MDAALSATRAAGPRRGRGMDAAEGDHLTAVDLYVEVCDATLSDTLEDVDMYALDFDEVEFEQVDDDGFPVDPYSFWNDDNGLDRPREIYCGPRAVTMEMFTASDDHDYEAEYYSGAREAEAYSPQPPDDAGSFERNVEAIDGHSVLPPYNQGSVDEVLGGAVGAEAGGDHSQPAAPPKEAASGAAPQQQPAVAPPATSRDDGLHQATETPLPATPLPAAPLSLPAAPPATPLPATPLPATPLPAAPLAAPPAAAPRGRSTSEPPQRPGRGSKVQAYLDAAAARRASAKYDIAQPPTASPPATAPPVAAPPAARRVWAPPATPQVAAVNGAQKRQPPAAAPRVPHRRAQSERPTATPAPRADSEASEGEDPTTDDEIMSELAREGWIASSTGARRSSDGSAEAIFTREVFSVPRALVATLAMPHAGDAFEERASSSSYGNERPDSLATLTLPAAETPRRAQTLLQRAAFQGKATPARGASVSLRGRNSLPDTSTPSASSLRSRVSLPGGSSPSGTSTPSGALFKKMLGAFRKSPPKDGRAPGSVAPERPSSEGMDSEDLVRFAADYQKLTSKRVSSLREL